MISQVSSPRLARRVSQGEKLLQQASISELHKTINAGYVKLEQSYQACSNKNEQYLLKVYLKVLDKMLDDVVYAQQKVNLVDCQFLKQQKCLAYVEEIAKYKNMVIEYKEKVQQKKQILNREKQKTENLYHERDELIEVNKRKQIELQRVRSVLEKWKEEQRKLKVKEKQRDKVILTDRIMLNENINEEQAESAVNPETERKKQEIRKINILKLGANLRKRKEIAQLSKSVRLQIENCCRIENPDCNSHPNIQDTIQSPHLAPFPELKITSKKTPYNPNNLVNEKLSQTLWLYLPSSYKRHRSQWKHKIEEKETQKLNSLSKSKYEYDNGLKYESQQSTKRSSQVNKSFNESSIRKK